MPHGGLVSVTSTSKSEVQEMWPSLAYGATLLMWFRVKSDAGSNPVISAKPHGGLVSVKRNGE